MLGEDETAAKNRLALICTNCRLVNGQAPPGVRTLEEVGRWRCSDCGSWNGTDARKAAREMVESARREAPSTSDGEEMGWEKVAKGTEAEPVDVPAESAEGSTGREQAEAPSATKRVTRSMATEDE